MASPSPTLADIIVQSSQGPKINPFVELIRGLDEKQNPPVDDSQTEGLLFSIATYIVVFLVCLAIISLPYLQGAGGHKRRHWVMKPQYLDGHPQPYWILNSGLIVAVSHLFGSTLFLVFLGLRYNAFKSGYAAESFYGSAWLELRWYPSYCSFFTQAWSTWFVRASDASLKGKSSGIHPLAFNINLIALPLTAFILALILISAQVASMSAQNNSYKDLISSLTVMSLQWHPGQNYLSSPLFHTASIQFLDYGTKSVHLLARFRTTGLFWTFMAVPTLIFYVIGISTLLRVMYKRFRAVKGESEHESTVSSFDSFPKRLMANRKRNKSSKLRNSFIYLGVHYTMMSLTLFYHIIIGLIFYFSDDVAMVNKSWLELFMVLSNSGSYLLLLALMVQLLRIISEGREQAGMVSKKSGRNAEYNDCISDSSRIHPDIKLMT
ncbi:uncharacterized protein PGTG_20873 [Puccinia graminis f. sp. tritici CRL 75-36-700-3]|uniref:Uncharacterized protein n=1 Tax=Puccinia graminis f. sp. tritici (strain CRL 75-36-700-3 / race SCCL) TaxID=418459 RepID=H6QPK6_PUCGT|nr:uncharacterized protein PGTG_20873 [Puccinia graminis f. sp. tritici CRL 75-36-700-3]EHS63891.1 hypothetical protein PGTG_20873 [Puccinia graminis f. sp. tritici CRL 75-36-700-3]